MANDDTVHVSIRIAASPATVFGFLSDPKRFQQWMGERSRLVAEPGGALTVCYPNGDVASGRIQELVPDRRIVFTWGYHGGTHGLPEGASRVVIELEAVKTGTVVRLTHTGLNAEQQRNHTMGWRHYLAALAVLASSEQLQDVAEGCVADYCAAWAETDPTRRMALLERAWHADGVFYDRMGAADGRAALSDYIANAQRFAPEMRLERTGDVQRVHGHVRYPWRIVTQDGKTAVTGENVCEFAADGRIASVVGFWDTPP